MFFKFLAYGARYVTNSAILQRAGLVPAAPNGSEEVFLPGPTGRAGL